MIHGVFGKLGSGKGLYVMDIIARELIDGFRDVVTNVPIRTLPWVNGQGVPQIGLRAYLLEKLYPLSEDEVDIILKRVLLIEDMEQMHDMYLNRRDGDTGDWFKMEVSKRDAKGRAEMFDMQEIKRRHCAPCLVIIDEAWAFFPNNGGWSREPILNFYSRQQRKLRDECYIVTQHPTDCDEVFWKIAQDFHVCRNHGMERMGMFKQPDMFRIIIYVTNPAKGNALKSYEMWRRLDKKLCQCYDTTAGVGIGGGFQGDANQKRGGLHIAWLVVGIVLLVVVLAAIPFGLRSLTTPFLTNTLSGGRLTTTNAPARAAVPAPAPLPHEAPAAAPQSPDRPRSSAQAQESVYCTGYSLTPSPVVFLSDGSSAEEPELSLIAKTYVVVNGVKYRVMPFHPVSNRQQNNSVFTPAAPPVPTPVVETSTVMDERSAQSSVQVITTGQAWAARRPPLSQSGFHQIQESPQPYGGGNQR